MKQTIAVDPAVLHEPASVDEDESEAVALAFVELLFAETNAFYEQHSLARRTIARLSDHLAGNVVDAMFAAVLQSEASIPPSSFQREGAPEPSARDRHSVRSLPCRSPDERHQQNQNDAMSSSSEKLQTTGGGGVASSSPSRESRGSSSPEKLGGPSSGLPRTRRKAADKGYPSVASHMPEGTRFVGQEEAGELYDNAAGCSTKSRKSVSLLQSGGTSSKTGKTVITKKKSGNGVMHLNDKLSRKRSIYSETLEVRRRGNQSRTAIYTRGVELQRNDTTLDDSAGERGRALPGRVARRGTHEDREPEHHVQEALRYKTWVLHQSLETDQLLHWSERDSLMSLSSTASSPSFHHHQEHNHTLKPYEEVPAEPIPAPYLSPIPTSALAIPRTHLAQSLSAPALRVRSPTNSKQNGPGPSLANSVSSTASTSDDFAKHRPRTALLMGKSSNPGGSSAGILAKKNARGGSAGNSTSNSAAAKAKAKYLREFPKPQPGIVKLSQIDDSQRLAWIS